MRLLFALTLLLISQVAESALVRVSWTNPTQNTDGSPFLDPLNIHVEWGTCEADNTYGYTQGITSVKFPATFTWVETTGLTVICFRAQVESASGKWSLYSNTARKVLVNLDRPITLGQPIILESN